VSSASRVAPTRINLIRLQRQLAQVNRGTVLLRRKREAIVSELFRIARPAVDARAVIAARIGDAYATLLAALADRGSAALQETAWPGREVMVDVAPAQVWGIPVSEILTIPALRRTPETRQTDPGLAGPSATRAAAQFEEVCDLLLRAASLEQRLRRLGTAVAQCTRQLRMLEERLAPQLADRIAAIRHTLEEREREEHIRLKHVQRRTRTRRG
jgi:V/A-type H+/Na+-transporting ATPase subunit D